MKRITSAVTTLAVAFTLCVGVRPLHSQSVVTGAPSSLGLSIGQDGSRGVSLGQSFLVPTGATTVQSFSVFLRNNAGQNAIPFRAYLVAWNPVLHTAVGPVLWQSESMNAVTSATLTRMTFSAPGVAVTAGNPFMFFLSGVGFYNANPTTSSAGIWALTSDNVTSTYADGVAYVQNIPAGDMNSVLTSEWAPFEYDFALEASFGVVPEPTTSTLLGGGLLMILGMRRWRSRGEKVARVRSVPM